MITRSHWAWLAGALFLLSAGLSACDQSPQQQGSNPAAEQSGDAAATGDGEMEKTE